MKIESTSRAAFFNSRLLIGFALFSVGLLLALAGLSKSVTGMIATAAQERPAAAGLASLPPEAQASISAQLANLRASDGAALDYLGYSVAVSGNTVVVGAPIATIGSNIVQGAVYVFVKPAGGWANMTETAKLTASDGTPVSLFGLSVAISGTPWWSGRP
jgi:hypothetical protein